MEHLASNLEQTGTGKGAVLKRKISWEQLEQRETVWNRIGTFHLTEGTNRNIKNNVLEHLASNLEQIGVGNGAVLQSRISEEQFNCFFSYETEKYMYVFFICTSD